MNINRSSGTIPSNESFSGVNNLGINSKIERSVGERSRTVDGREKKETYLELKMNVNGTTHSVKILSDKTDKDLAIAEISAKMATIYAVLSDNKKSWNSFIKNSKGIHDKVRNGLSSEKSPGEVNNLKVTNSIYSLINKTVFGNSLVKQTKAAIVSKMSNILVSKKETNLKAFLPQLSEQIALDKQKLEGIEQELLTATGQDKEDLKVKQKGLRTSIDTQMNFQEHLSQDGLQIYREVENNMAPDVFSDASTAINLTLTSAEQQKTTFDKTASKLIGLTTSNNPEMNAKMNKLKMETNENLEIGISQFKIRATQPILWGMTKICDPATGKPRTDQKLTSTDVANAVISPLRLNTAEHMAAFIGSFHKEVLLGDILKDHLETETKEGLETETKKGLKKEGLSSFSEQDKAANLAHFTTLCGGNKEKAEELNSLYTTLFHSYKARSENPQKYINIATEFVEKFNTRND